MGYSINSSSDNCYPGTTVLVNKPGAKTQELLNDVESTIVTIRWVEIAQQGPPKHMDFDYYCNLHKYLFGDIYEWAGDIRTIGISKKSTVFCPPNEIKQVGESIFEHLDSQHYFIELPKTQYVRAIAELYHRLNMLHPFREGNGRVQRLFFSLLVRRAGYELDFSKCDTDFLMVATIFASQGIMDHLIQFFNTAIH